MNEIISIYQDQLVTTTLAIAEGTNNDHASVIKLVRSYQTDLEEFGLLDFKSESTGGRPTEYALLNEQQSTLIMTYMRNSDIVRKFKKRLVKGFWEMRSQLASKQAFAIPQSMSEALRLAADLSDQRDQAVAAAKQAQSTIEHQAPKVEALDRIAASSGTMCITDAAKELKVARNKLYAVMEKSRWIYRRPPCTDWIAYDDKRHQGLLEHAIVSLVHSDGTPWGKPQVRITKKGLVKLAHILNDEQKAA